jgi:hypothetical protein
LNFLGAKAESSRPGGERERLRDGGGGLIDEGVLYPFVVLGGLILGLVVGRWWTLAAALCLGLWIAITTEVDEVSPWFLGSAYTALAAAGIAVGVVIRQRLRV